MILLAAEAGSRNGSAVVGNLVMFALIGGAMYLLVLRPQRRRVRAVAAAQAGLEPGREVMLTSGIYGTVLHVDESKLGVEIAPGVQITVARAAVAQVVDLPAHAAADDEPDAPLN